MGMMSAIASVGSYGHLTLAPSLYLMTLLAAVGYFAVIGAGELLNRVGDSTKKSANGNGWQIVVTTFAKERWVWIAPLVVILTIYLSVIFQPGHAETGPVMYALF
jgi:putative exporter of polyketide antibiotics